MKMLNPETQAQEKLIPMCEQCSKHFSSKQALTRHMKTLHDGIVSLKNLFSTPKALSQQKRLFTSVPDLSTQGNSARQENIPRVMSEGTFMCGDCDNRFLNQQDLTNHKINVHDNAIAANDNAVVATATNVEETRENMLGSDDDQGLLELIEAAEEEAALYEALEMVSW